MIITRLPLLLLVTTQFIFSECSRVRLLWSRGLLQKGRSGKTQLWGAQGAWCGIQGPTAAPARAPSHQRDAHTHARASPSGTRWGHMCLRNPQFKHILKSGNFGKPQLILVTWQHQEISWSFESNARTANTEAALSQSLQWGKKNQNLMIILWIPTAKLTKVAIQRSGYA